MTEDKKIASEDILVDKWDRCISNMVVKTGIGISIGIVASALVLRSKRSWPIMLGGSFGAGSAYADCQRQFGPYALLDAKIIKEKPKV